MLEPLNHLLKAWVNLYLLPGQVLKVKNRFFDVFSDYKTFFFYGVPSGN